MPASEEELIWGEGKRKEGRLGPGTKTDRVLADRFPELINAGGDIDPREAIVSLLDRIEELTRRVEDGEVSGAANQGSSGSSPVG